MSTLVNGGGPQRFVPHSLPLVSHHDRVHADPYAYRDLLPSISHLDLDKAKSDQMNNKQRFSTLSGLSISTAPLSSPTAPYPGPPPPYSSISSANGSVHGLSGYMSPPESTTRRSIRDEKDSPSTHKSLPSIQEALGDRSVMQSLVPPSHTPLAAPASVAATGHSFPSAPLGPRNPFTQPTALAASTTAPPCHQPVTTIHTHEDGLSRLHSVVSAPAESKTNVLQQNTSQRYSYPVSPRASFSSAPRGSVGHPSMSNGQTVPPQQDTTYPSGASRPEFSAMDHNTHGSVHHPPSTTTFKFEPDTKFDDSRNPFAPANAPAHYGETVKRHLDIYDAEIALGEIHNASDQMLSFSHFWGQRYQQANRTSLLADNTPDLRQIDDMLRQSQRTMDYLTKFRQIVVSHQTALSEERARSSRQPHDEYHGLSDEYKPGGFAGGDAKKRRGKAAPPGRCHSCNRAETPEWRRGPDGARTLCNACGLHYAKLTRKMGANKNAPGVGSNLRPKSLDSRP